LFSTSSAPTGIGDWATTSLLGALPLGTRSIRFGLTGEYAGSGTARNVSYDAVSAVLLDELPARDRVAGNLVMFNDNGGWSWYQDERAIVDQTSGSLLIGSVGNYMGNGGEPRDGDVDVTAFNLNTGSRRIQTLGNIPTLDKGDDHNVASLWQRSDGRFVAMYTGHLYGSGINGAPNGSDNAPRSFYRISTSPHDATAWQSEQTFTWPSNDTTSPVNNDVTYSNLLFMANEGSGDGRLYNLARAADRTMNFSYSDNEGQTWNYGGKLSLTSSAAQQSQYSNGYFKFSSNNTDRIDFIATEHHPRDFNNSIYHGYIQNGKSYDAAGNVIDANIFDEVAPAPAQFTPVWSASTVTSTSHHHGWTAELERDGQGNLYALFTSRYGTTVQDSLTGDGDHRLFYARFDAQSGAWSTTELGKMGGPLHADEEDYTGIGAINPNDPSTIYISTVFDPRDETPLAKHEIFKGVTNNLGMTWQWTAITENSTYDNLRPIIPSWNGNDTAVLWLRGNYPWQRDYDLTVVGLVERSGESLGVVQYVDATTSNTTLSDGSPFAPTGPSSSAGVADGNWHQRISLGNGGTVFTADESATENAPMLRTTISDMLPGEYDIFVFFWADVNQDWRIEAGLSPTEMSVFRMQGAQQAEANQFAATMVLDEGNRSLYRSYIGRVDLSVAGSVQAFINDSTGSGTQSVWYDGLGYSLVTDGRLAGDFDGDDDVDGDDFLMWQRGGSPNSLSSEDLAIWRQAFGSPQGLTATVVGNELPVPEISSAKAMGLGIALLLQFFRQDVKPLRRESRVDSRIVLAKCSAAMSIGR
jgi:hypothetical protein